MLWRVADDDRRHHLMMLRRHSRMFGLEHDGVFISCLNVAKFFACKSFLVPMAKRG